MANALATSISGLQAAERAIATASHNIANAGTVGFSRQRNILTPNTPQQSGGNYLGTGVQTNSIQRIHDQIIETQLQSQSTELNRVAAFNSMAENIDQLMSGIGLNTAQTNFFNALEDAANNPHSASQSTQIVSAAENLVSQFNYLNGQLESMEQDINNAIDGEVSLINGLAASIHDINKQIGTSSVSTGSPPNDLLDRRDTLLQELASHIDVASYDHGHYGFDVNIGNGVPLVTIAGVSPLTAMPRDDNPRIKTVAVTTATGSANIAGRVSGGTLGGLFEFSREVLTPIKNEVGLMARVLAHEVNTIYQAGLQQPQARLFESAAVQTFSNTSNSGTAQASAQILNTSLLSATDYELKFDGSEYTLTRLNDNTSITGPGPLLVDGIQFEVSAGAVAGDRFLVSPTANAASTIKVANVNASTLTQLHEINGQTLPLAQTLSGLRDATIFDNNSATLTEHYAGLVTRIGSLTRNSQNQLQSMEQIYSDTVTRHDSKSGVNLDEEAANLLQYQRAYEASAKVISLSSTLFDTIIRAMNRI